MRKISLDKLNTLFSAISQNETLYLPTDTKAGAKFEKWEEYIDKMFYRGPGDRSKNYYEYLNPEKMFYKYMKFYDINNKPESWYLNYKKIFFEKIPKY